MATKNQFPCRDEYPVPISFCCLELNSDPIECSTKAVSILQNGYVIESGQVALRHAAVAAHAHGQHVLFWEHWCTATVLGGYMLSDGLLNTAA